MIKVLSDLQLAMYSIAILINIQQRSTGWISSRETRWDRGLLQLRLPIILGRPLQEPKLKLLKSKRDLTAVRRIDKMLSCMPAYHTGQDDKQHDERDKSVEIIFL